MVNTRPPMALPGTPGKVTLAPGAGLFRLHAAHRPAGSFNTVRAHPFYGGGRFDGTDHDPYGYVYAGLTSASAVCESLLRSVPFDGAATARLVPRSAVRGRRLSFLRLATEVTLLPLLSGRDLAAVAQDTWLTQAEAAHYPFTRHWGHWIRENTAPWAQGFIWPSKREPADHVVVLFSDRCPAGVIEETGLPPVDFEAPEGEEWLNSVLEPYLARVAP
ncbi:RES family NAD+ phosphorylase [Streptomyces clavifer]|uniref:RES family NAD+ phosphorylase n=1 Tax=Streptomyces clavifer TaxID=68188 RepID=UPI003330283D